MHCCVLCNTLNITILREGSRIEPCGHPLSIDVFTYSGYNITALLLLMLLSTRSYKLMSNVKSLTKAKICQRWGAYTYHVLQYKLCRLQWTSHTWMPPYLLLTWYLRPPFFIVSSRNYLSNYETTFDGLFFRTLHPYWTPSAPGLFSSQVGGLLADNSSAERSVPPLFGTSLRSATFQERGNRSS